MRYIYTLDTGGWIPDHVRASHLDAAERWGAEYRVLAGAIDKRGDTFGVKLELGKLPLADDDRVAWLDGDVLVRSDCPSLFDLVEPEYFGGVANYQGDTHANPWKDHLPWWERATLMAEAVMPVAFAGAYSPDTYVNGGVLVWTHGHHRHVFNMGNAAAPAGRTVNPMIEQTLQNVMLAGTRTPVRMLPREFNRLGPAVWTARGAMPWLVGHWANIHGYRGNKAEAMKRVQWRVG